MEVKLIKCLTDAEKHKYENKLHNNSVITDTGCELYKVNSSDGYVRIGVKGKSLLAHRFAYFYEHQDSKSPPRFEISHLCHRKNCINFDHLSLEPSYTNKLRRHCVLKNKCVTHGKFRNCIL